jgi:hypothetical protein
MRVVLTKDYKVHARVLPKGTELNFTREKAEELIGLKVAKLLDKDLTKEEYADIEATVEKMVEEGEVPQDTPISEVKKVTPKGKG